MKKIFLAMACFFCSFVPQNCNGMKNSLVARTHGEDSDSQYEMCQVVDNISQSKFAGDSFAQNSQGSTELLDVEYNAKRSEGKKTVTALQKVSGSRVQGTDLPQKGTLTLPNVALTTAHANYPIFRVFTYFVPTGATVLPETRIESAGCAMMFPPLKLEYAEGTQLALWINEISALLSEIIAFAQCERWKEACEVSDGLFKHKFKDFISAEESTTKLLTDFLHSMSIGLGMRLCETQTKYDRHIQREYGPCYAFCTMDYVKDLFKIKLKGNKSFVGISKSGDVDKDTLRTAAVYLYVLHDFQCGGSIDPRYYSTPYKIALLNMLKDGAPPRNFISWALKIASLDFKTKKIAVEWGVTPSL
jgi:hypothetical protein